MTSIPDQTARAWADVTLAAIVANARTVATVSEARLLPMLKANGYGVGAVAVARALEPLDPWGYGVATVEEGAELRAAGISRPILVFTPLHPTLVGHHLRDDLRPVIGDVEALRAWRAAGARPFHIEIDTGMSRTGFRWNSELSWRELLREAPGFEGAFTQFHSAEQDPTSVAAQWGRFQSVLAGLPAQPLLAHAANSATALAGRTYAGDLVRPGIFLYGGGGTAEYTPQPVVRLQARVVAVRDVLAGEGVSYGATWKAPQAGRIATLGIGYADGLLRSLGNVGLVELGGRVVRIAGRVTMDFVMVPGEARTAIGDVATIFGGLVSLDDQAQRGGTIGYELLTAMGPRVHRRYL
jgi:alanine racemase